MRSGAAAALLLAVATACAEPTATDPGTGGPIEHLTGARDLLLKIEHTGGFAPLEYTFTNVPAFALYGDGTLVQMGAQIAIYPAPALPAIFERALTEDGVQAVLREALEAGLDRDASYTDLGSMGIADAHTTIFTFKAAGEAHVVEAYALGFEGSDKPEGMPQEEFAARTELLGLLEGVGEMATMVPAGSIGEEGPYVGSAARLLVGPYQPDEELPQEPRDWPLAEPLADFGAPAEGFDQDRRCGVVEGDDWVAVRALAREANERTPWTSGEETFALVFRPLLPDESGC